MFIYNTPMTVVPEVELHAQITSYPRNAPKKIGDYELVIYKITSPTTPQPEFIATLYVPKTTEVLDSDNFELNSTRLDVSESTYFNPFVGTQQTNMSLKAKQNLLTECDFVKKNVVSAQVIYNGFNLQTALGSNAAFEYSILGSGDYEFVFADLAGNVHQFSETENRLHLTILREVAITVNGHSPINGAIYSFDRYAENSTPVTISVVGGGNYYLRNSINIKVQKNWQDYSGFGQQNYNYTFTEYGNYRVSFTATDLFEQLGAPLTKTIEFSIINPNEASELLDLTRLGNFTFTKISKLVNGTRQDITAGFKQVVNMQNGMMLDYKTLLAHREEFRTSSGKQTFEITYLVDNDIYEPREVTFAATLNNEQPIIYCSLEYGQSSTSGFSISYTPSIIYDQVGDSAIYINNVLVATIDKTSASQTEVVEQYFSQAEYGTGDYLIVLYSSSGVPLTYYKVTLNEPLNVWAIIIIVVVVAVVTTVIVLIFVLRHKMRIR